MSVEVYWKYGYTGFGDNLTNYRVPFPVGYLKRSEVECRYFTSREDCDGSA